MSQAPTKFCTACGNNLVPTAAICPSCGTPSQNITPVAQVGKSKTTAVLLAVFVGFWAWLYTFQVNKTKFFIGLGAQILISIIYFVALFQYFAAQLNSYNYNCDYYYSCNDSYDSASTTSFIAAVAVISIIGLGLRAWEIIDNARRPESFYLNYPNER